MITRRTLIRGIAALLAAPAIIKAASLMPVRSARLGWLITEPETPWGATTTYYYMDIKAIQNRNVLLQPADYIGSVQIASYREIILPCDETMPF